MKGSIAIGSRRSTPVLPVAAVVVSLESIAPTSTPCAQSSDWYTSGTRLARRPPKMIAEIGTPCGSLNLDEMPGHCVAGAVKREFGCAAGSPFAASYGLPRQSVMPSGALPRPSHHGWRSFVTATLVKMVFLQMVAIAFGLVSLLVPGATPKKPFSGLIAHRRPSDPGRSQAMSSPT